MPGFELIGEDERNALNTLFDEGGVLFAHGFQGMRKKYHVREFESMVAEKLNTQHALAVTSGTSALKVALKSLGVGPGDEVITQAFNFIATVEAILDLGAVPVIANVDKTLNMDPLVVESLVTNKTKVIMPVHMLGVPVDMSPILDIAKKYNLKVLEDNCESLGAKYNGKYLGTIGDSCAISFDFGKVITCGEGGMVLTRHSELDKYAREYHDHGHENNPSLPRGRDSKSIYGFNYRITEMQAVVGKAQFAKLDMIIDENKKRYDELLTSLSGAFEMRTIPKGSAPIYDTFIFYIEDRLIRDKVIDLLNQTGFGTKNLPDAIEWHCAAYWDHALSAEVIKNLDKTKDLLINAVAVPIWLRKSPTEYEQLGKSLKEVAACCTV